MASFFGARFASFSDRLTELGGVLPVGAAAPAAHDGLVEDMSPADRDTLLRNI
jgi:hypothetical protein